MTTLPKQGAPAGLRLSLGVGAPLISIMTAKILNRLDTLISEGLQLREQWRNIYALPDKEREEAGLRRARWAQSVRNVLEYAGLDKFWSEIDAILSGQSYPAYQFAQAVGILQSARNELDLGIVGKLKYLLHADLFNSIIDQASELLSTGHIIPAAVLGRIALEQWLRDQAEKEGLPNHETDKAAIINDGLKKAGVFSTPKWREIQSLLDIGNAAAHGKPDQFNNDDVRRLLEFIRLNCL